MLRSVATLASPPTLRFSSQDETLRRRVAAFVADHGEVPNADDYADRIRMLAEWQATLHDAGFVGLSWPRAVGGHGLGLAAEAVVAEELAAAGMPELINRLGLFTLGRCLLDVGSESQQDLWLPGILDASEIWCQGFSEPDAGSDLASVRTRATRVSDGWRLDGQKVWTSRAQWSRWCMVLARTDPSARPHHGLSMFVVDLQAEGVTVRPLLQALHEPHFSEVLFEGVHVPWDHLLGEPGQGWHLAMSAMNYERGLFMLERQIRLRRRLADLADRVHVRDGAGHNVLLGRLAAHFAVLRARIYCSLAAQEAGTLAAGATSVDKLLLTEADQGLFGAAFSAFGEELALEGQGWTHDLIESRAVSIYSGTSEIQRNIVAKRLLDLPMGS